MSNLENYMKQQAIFCEQNDSISKNLYSEYGVKRGLSASVWTRNHSGRMCCSIVAMMGLTSGVSSVTAESDNASKTLAMWCSTSEAVVMFDQAL